MPELIGPYTRNRVTLGDCRELVTALPDESIDVIVTSPPYWGQRTSAGMGVEEDPREYVRGLVDLFTVMLPKLKKDGIAWVNVGDAYNTEINWKREDWVYSTLGTDRAGHKPTNSAYTKNRAARQPFTEKTVPWLTYGNLLALPYRIVTGMCDEGWMFRGEVMWRKTCPMPEGRCRRPHRGHEPIYLFARDRRHNFQVTPPVKSVWEFGSEKIAGRAHYSRFPLELPSRCIEAYGRTGDDVVVLDPFSGSGTTGITALEAGCSFVGFEIDPGQVDAANARLATASAEHAA